MERVLSGVFTSSVWFFYHPLVFCLHFYLPVLLSLVGRLVRQLTCSLDFPLPYIHNVWIFTFSIHFSSQRQASILNTNFYSAYLSKNQTYRVSCKIPKTIHPSISPQLPILAPLTDTYHHQNQPTTSPSTHPFIHHPPINQPGKREEE